MTITSQKLFTNCRIGPRVSDVTTVPTCVVPSGSQEVQVSLSPVHPRSSAAGADPYVAFDRTGAFLATDGTTAFDWRTDGTFSPIAVPSCNRNAPTRTSAVDSQGRFLFWNGGAATIAPPGTQQPFGC